jgi:hypothetical protein
MPDSADMSKYADASELSLEERETIYSASAPQRYDYFIKRVTRKGQVWALWDDDGWLTTVGKDEAERFLVWPDEEFARRAFAEEGHRLWPKATIDHIAIEKWIGEVLPRIASFDDKVWVFPAGALSGGVVDARDVLRDLTKEAKWLEGRTNSWKLQGADLNRKRIAKSRKRGV